MQDESGDYKYYACKNEKGADTLSGTGRGTGDQGEDWQENPYYYGTGGL